MEHFDTKNQLMKPIILLSLLRPAVEAFFAPCKGRTGKQ
jgi:hypothetical protein